MSILRLRETDSTNLEARRRIAKGEEGPLWIIAGRQTAGRGRFDRKWLSRPGNLTTSYIFKPRRHVRHAAPLSLLAGAAVLRAVTEVLPEAPVILKWPNDVLIGDAKLAGILLESEGPADDPTLIIGIGINVKWAPDNLAYPATSLARHRENTDIEALFRSLRGQFDALLAVWQDQGFAPIRAIWLAHTADLGTPLRVRLADKTLDGHFGGLDETGALLLDTSNGPLAITAGDVFFAPIDSERET